LAVALLLAMAGQYYFAQRRQYLWDGIAFYTVACLLFLAFARHLERRPGEEARASWDQRLADWLKTSPLRRAVLVASGMGSLGTLYFVRVGRRSGSYGPPFLLWLASISLYILASWNGVHSFQAVRSKVREVTNRLLAHGVEVALVTACTLLAFALRMVALESIPYVLSGDEASMGLEAVRVIEGDLRNMFATGWLSHPTLFFFIQSLPLRAFGRQVWVLRLQSVLAATLTLPFFYLLMREIFDRRIALTATGILATYHYHIHYARMGLNNIDDGLFITVTLLCLVRGRRTRRRGYFVAAGLALGLSQYFYMGARLIPMLVAMLVVFWSLRDRAFLSRHMGDLVALAGAFLVVALPILAFWWTHPADFTARLSQLGIVQSGWLARERELTGRSAVSLLGGQILRSLLAFNYYVDPAFHYRPGIPLLGFWPSICFVLGLAYTVSHLRDEANVTTGLWFFLGLIFGSVLMENPASSHRLVILGPVLCAFVALGLVKVVILARQSLRFSRRASTIALIALVLLIGIMDVRFYFRVYTPNSEFGGPNTLVADRMGQYLHSLGGGWKAYMFTPPRIYSGFPTIPYRAPEVPREDVVEPLTGRPTFVDSSFKAVFLFLPEREPELKVVRNAYPSGTLRRFPSQALRRFIGRGDLPPLFLAYEVERP
jgi:4-amino-4-deoxy-L-arabinose transferase-like glycosyltransferase